MGLKGASMKKILIVTVLLSAIPSFVCAQDFSDPVLAWLGGFTGKAVQVMKDGANCLYTQSARSSNLTGHVQLGFSSSCEPAPRMFEFPISRARVYEQGHLCVFECNNGVACLKAVPPTQGTASRATLYQALPGTCEMLASALRGRAAQAEAAIRAEEIKVSRRNEEVPVTNAPVTSTNFTPQSFAPTFNVGLLIALGFLIVGGLAVLLSKKAAPSVQPSPSPIVQAPLQTLAQQTTPQPFSDSGPVKGMALRLKRSERPGTFGSIVFTLDARIDMSAENRALIVKYKLGNRVIYDSANRRKYAEKTADHLDNSRNDTSLFDSPGRQAWGVAKTFARLGAAAVNATVAALSLRITVDSLMQGVHVECKDMAELLEAEEAITEAGRNLKAELTTATSFSGQEQVIDL